MTNFEKIKSMTIEEMGKTIYDFLMQDFVDVQSEVFCSMCGYVEETCDGECDKGLRAWLNKEIEE